jgi:dTDP-4-dehydrorhamnose 3,5-epimerase
MNFRELELPGVHLITPTRSEDERGHFMRTWCRDTFARAIGPVEFVQASQSYNRRAGTVRGLHYQRAPYGEAKLVRCIRGAIYDVVADIRPGSPTYGHWLGRELSKANGEALFIPEGLAHGFQTLDDDSEVAYQISAEYRPEMAGGVRWNDRTLNIRWPIPVTVMSRRDMELPDLATVCAA